MYTPTAARSAPTCVWSKPRLIKRQAAIRVPGEAGWHERKEAASWTPQVSGTIRWSKGDGDSRRFTAVGYCKDAAAAAAWGPPDLPA